MGLHVKPHANELGTPMLLFQFLFELSYFSACGLNSKASSCVNIFFLGIEIGICMLIVLILLYKRMDLLIEKSKEIETLLKQHGSLGL